MPDTEALALNADQVPPAVPSVSCVVLPAHTDEEPVMAPAVGNGLTVITCVAYAVPQPLVTA